MTLRINTNIAALNSVRNLEDTDRKLAESLQRLSSGFKINKGADNPAGLVISGEENLTFKAASGLTQLGRALEALALVQPGHAVSLTQIASSSAEEIGSGASVVIISPSPADVVSEAAKTLQAAGAGVVPVLLDPVSFAGGAPTPTAQVRIPGTALDAYVVHLGDELGLQLDYRLHGSYQGLDVELLGVKP